MQCPAGDGQLQSHSTTNSNGLTLTYGQCSRCNGFWMNGFDANYISPDTIKDQPPPEPIAYPKGLHCPICKSILDQAHEDSIVPGVVLYKCPTGHGYFFPPGEFLKFKEGQTSKISFFKLWKIPFGSPIATLLTTLVGLVLSAGLVVGVLSTGQEQVTTTQAEEILTRHGAYVSGSTVTFTATTSGKATVQVHIPALQEYIQTLESEDSITHVSRLLRLNAGTYEYYFTIISEGNTIESDTFTFTIDK